MGTCQSEGRVDDKDRKRKNNPEDLVDIKRNPRFIELEERYIETY